LQTAFEMPLAPDDLLRHDATNRSGASALGFQNDQGVLLSAKTFCSLPDFSFQGVLTRPLTTEPS
jgi:hypothetical protein